MNTFSLFLEALNNDDFVQGHEILEERWKLWKKDPLMHEESLILKGLINGSTALALWKLGRAQGALKVWETFEKYAPLIHEHPYENTPFYFQAEALLKKKYALHVT